MPEWNEDSAPANSGGILEKLNSPGDSTPRRVSVPKSRNSYLQKSEIVLNVRHPGSAKRDGRVVTDVERGAMDARAGETKQAGAYGKIVWS
jgi:hypothetical protein